MKAVLLDLYSLDYDLSHFSPEPGKAFSIYVEASVGSNEGESNDIFTVEVCNPEWLKETLEEKGVMTGRHKIAMTTFHHELLHIFIKNVIESGNDATWQELSEEIGNILHYEFEDYNEYQDTVFSHLPDTRKLYCGKVQDFHFTDQMKIGGPHFLPEDPFHFSCNVSFTISSLDTKETHRFLSRIMTPSKLGELLKENKIISGKNIFFINHFDHDRIIKDIERRVRSCYSFTWHDFIKKITRFCMKL